MVKVGLLIRLEALAGKEADVESFLEAGLPMVQEEPATFGIFDVFPDESGRFAAALMENASKLFAQPTIEKIDVIAAKLAQ